MLLLEFLEQALAAAEDFTYYQDWLALYCHMIIIENNVSALHETPEIVKKPTVRWEIAGKRIFKSKREWKKNSISANDDQYEMLNNSKLKIRCQQRKQYRWFCQNSATNFDLAYRIINSIIANCTKGSITP